MRAAARNAVVLAVVAIIAAPRLLADHTHADHDHGVLGDIGKASFPTGCNAAAQAEIDRGVTLMHSFWYVEAEAAFRAAAAADADCGSAWWGVALSNYHPLWTPPTPAEFAAGKEAAEKAAALPAKTARERDFIAAIQVLYADAERLDHRARTVAFEQAMGKVAAAHPDDLEASVFHALLLTGTALPTDKTYANQKRAAEILNRVLPKAPEHPGIAHYVIHSFDYPELAALALPAARTYAKLAPGSPHALHMPSHIFTRLGLWGESIASNLASAAKARSYIAERKGADVTSFEELHAVDYLVYAYLQEGRDDEARTLLEALRRVNKLDTPNFAAAYALAAVPARYALERRAWAEAAALRPLPFDWEKIPYAEANVHFARALGAARTGDLELARDAVARIALIQRTLVEQKNAYWADQVEIQRRGAEGWLRFAEKKPDLALERMRASADLEASTEKSPVTPGAVLPARELLADMLLELSRPQEALVELERSLRDAPNRKNGLRLAAQAARGAGADDQATAYERALAKLQGSAP
jgi:hypothetical protein